MRRIVGIVGLVSLLLPAGGCFLYFDEEDPDVNRPMRDAGPIHMPDARVPAADTMPPECEYPSHSTSCAEVPYFQSGFMAHCDGSTLVVEWYEHVFCEGYPEEIIFFACTHECEDTCVEGRIGWPESGEALVAAACVDGGVGSSCQGQCGLALEDCFCDEACVENEDCCEDYEEFCAACEGLEEEACKANVDCKPVYTGLNCTDPDGNACTSSDSNCTCESFEFAACMPVE